MRKFRVVLLFSLLAGVLAISACGSDDESSGDGGGGTSASGKTDPGDRTIGVIPSTSASENLSVWIAQLKAAGEPLGWKINVCDGAGNPQTMESCAQNFVTQKADAIVTMALGGPEIPTGMKQAKDAGIPILALGTSVNPGYEKQYDGVFGDDIVKMGENTADYVDEKFPDQPIVGLEITQNYGGQGYVEGMKKGLEAKGKKYDDLRDTNLADIVNSMKSNTEAILQDNPGKLTFVGFNDTDPAILWPDIERLGRAEDVTLITRYDNPSTVKIMRGDGGGNVLASLSTNWQHHFDMLDALLAHWTKDEPLPDPASTTDTPGAKVAGVEDFPDGQDRAYPFDPALKEKVAEWEQTYELEPSTMKAP